MTTTVATVICVALGLLLALVAGIEALRNRRVGKPLIALAGVTEAAVLFYVGVRIVDLAGGHHTSGLAIVLAYLVGLILTLPVAAALGWAEPSKWGTVTLGAGALIACVLFARINQLWNPHG